MVRSDKIELVQKTAQQIRQSQSLVLAQFQGLTVAEMTDLRSRLREQGVALRVIKNRLIRRALAEAGVDPLDDMLHGTTVVAFGVRDPVAPARILTEYAKDHAKLEIKGGLLDGRRLDAAGVKQLAAMPDRRQLLAMMAGDLKQPATRLAGVMQGALLKIVHAMQALGRKLENAGAGSSA